MDKEKYGTCGMMKVELHITDILVTTERIKDDFSTRQQETLWFTHLPHSKKVLPLNHIANQSLKLVVESKKVQLCETVIFMLIYIDKI